ncbi:hypothetical protein BpHYR1_001576 [Brachionus plicatilis]|uniref:Uncharacterized protein n=1 Tax=Brachionus plicatilis TaxID=10195 RepID=A0A3M7PX76_BRAPC|nr:hypothetical protein BpHYR1_001576 [Brachionus plicatilis]
MIKNFFVYYNLDLDFDKKKKKFLNPSDFLFEAHGVVYKDLRFTVKPKIQVSLQYFITGAACLGSERFRKGRRNDMLGITLVICKITIKII